MSVGGNCLHGVSTLLHCSECAKNHPIKRSMPVAEQVKSGLVDSASRALAEEIKNKCRHGNNPIDCGHCRNEQVQPRPVARGALDVQIGGGHYKDLKIQPVEFVHANGLGFLEGCVIKRLCRYKQKAGRQDLEKAIHEIQLLIDLEYGNQGTAKK